MDILICYNQGVRRGNGGRFEFDRGGWTKEFELLTPMSCFTDDTDTIAAIAGAMAEGMYGVPGNLKTECLNRLPDEMRSVISDFAASEEGFNGIIN